MLSRSTMRKSFGALFLLAAALAASAALFPRFD
jgi:hypothetical protein